MITLNTFSTKIPQETSIQKAQTPSFGNINTSTDSVAFSENLTRGEQRILDAINANRNPNERITLSKKTLQAINNLVILDKCNCTGTLYSIGKNCFKISSRKFLIENAGQKSSALLHFLDNSIFFNRKRLIDATGLSSLYPKLSTSKKNTNFFKTLAIIYTHESQDTVNEFLNPHLKAEVYSKDAKKLAKLTKDYYFNEETNEEKFRIKVSKTSGGYAAEGTVDEKVVGHYRAKNSSDAVSKLCLKILGDLNLLPDETPTVDRITTMRYTGSVAAKEQAEAILKCTGFADSSLTLDLYKDRKVIELISHAVAPSNGLSRPFNFQELEFLGDAVANLCNARYLAQKHNSRSVLDQCYRSMISNERYRACAQKLGLDKFLKINHKFHDVKIYADMFEAFIGALSHLYPSKRIYEFLKPLCEESYQDAIRKLRTIR